VPRNTAGTQNPQLIVANEPNARSRVLSGQNCSVLSQVDNERPLLRNCQVNLLDLH
jgi:hypothetical protein